MDFKDNEEVASFINWLFDELQGIFPAFKQAWPSQPDFEKVKRVWTLAFTESDLKSMNQVKIGLRRFRASPNPFVPTAGQFIAMCKPTAKELGLPSLETAYAESCKNSHPCADKNWSHKAIYHAWKQTGSHLLSTYPRMNSFPVFERNYEATIKMLVEGEELFDIPVAITHQTETLIVTKEVGLSHLAKLKQMLK